MLVNAVGTIRLFKSTKMKNSVSLSHEPYFKCASIVHVWWLPLWTAEIDDDFITRRKFYQTVLISRLRNSE